MSQPSHGLLDWLKDAELEQREERGLRATNPTGRFILRRDSEYLNIVNV